jgi:hypothetical protein
MPRKAHRRSRLSSWFTRKRLALGLTVSLLAVAWPAYSALAAQPPVNLATAGSFAVLGGSAVTNTGPSTLNGNLGVSPGTALTGFPPGTVNGSTYAADAVAQQAQSDLTTAYNDAAGRIPPVAVTGDLGGQTLTPGVYNSASSLGLTGQLTLNAQGDPNAVFIFQAGSTLTTASASDVALINGAQACNVFWQTGSSATLGTASVFTGSILAYTSISVNSDVTVAGSLLARNGAVTLIDDTITPSVCATTAAGTGTGTTGTAGTGTTGTGTTGTGTTGTGTTGTGTGTGTATGTVVKPTHGTSVFAVIPKSVAAKIKSYGTGRCIDRTFKVAVTGKHIRRVVFSMGRQVLSVRNKPAYDVTVNAVGGIRTVTARVTYNDPTKPASYHLKFRACAAAAVKRPQPATPVAPGGFTG